jgi:hypothetical protein
VATKDVPDAGIESTFGRSLSEQDHLLLNDEGRNTFTHGSYDHQASSLSEL